MFFNDSDIMAHKAMTGHYQFEKRNEQRYGSEKRKEIYAELVELGISARPLDPLPDDALQELLDSLKKAKSKTEKERK